LPARVYNGWRPCGKSESVAAGVLWMQYRG
jgi:hypothetical protein